MAASPLPSRAYLTEAARETSLANLPSESDMQTETEVKQEPGLPLQGTGPHSRVFWKDLSAAPGPHAAAPPPAGLPRLKRSMMDSPFAGSASKRPFRRRDLGPETAEDGPSSAVAVSPKEEPSLALPTNSDDGITTDNLLARLPSVPAVVTTSTYMQVSMNPVIWRTQEAPGGLMMHVGLSGIQLEGQHDLQLYLWSTMNPRIVTTGIPHRATSCELADRLSSSGLSGAAEASAPDPGAADEAASDDDTDASRTRHGRTYSAAPVAAPPKRERLHLMLEEVFLVRKDPRRRIPDEVFHTCGPFEGGTVMCMPDWPGDIWSFDIVCRASDGSGEPIWVKSLDRRLQ